MFQSHQLADPEKLQHESISIYTKVIDSNNKSFWLDLTTYEYVQYKYVEPFLLLKLYKNQSDKSYAFSWMAEV